MKMLSKILSLGIILPLNAIASEALSGSNGISSLSENVSKISYIPQLYLTGYAGDHLVGQGDLLIPLYLTNENAFIAYAQGRYSPHNEYSYEEDTWMGSAGFLYRQIVANQSVLGAYVFGDYNQANSVHKYWVIAPGVESLGRTWDFHLNGYIPLGDKYWENEAWAQEFGDYSYIEFQEGTNNVYDHRLAYYEETGIGGDVEVGRKLFKAGNTLVKGYLQGYYYSMDHNSDVTGGGAKITIQPSRYLTFSINDTYDNYQHNVFMVGAQIRLNDLFNKSNKPIDENNLTDRLLDPVDRNYAALGNGNSSLVHRGDQTYDLGQSLFTSNGVFFSDNGSGYVSPNADQYAKGTYGNPYTEEDDITTYGMQAIFNDIEGGFVGPIYMYFAPGDYTASDGSSAINVYDGMNIYGRNYWYTTPTSGDQRATFYGALNLYGNNTLDSIRVYNVASEDESELDATSAFDTGITIKDADNVKINNVEVGALGVDAQPVTAYATGLSLDNSNVIISNSSIYGYQYGAGEIEATGILMTNGGSLTVSNSKVYGEANEISNSYDDTGNGYGIHADGKQETIIVQDGSDILGQGQGGLNYSGNGYGILVGENLLNNTDGDYSIHDNVVSVENSTLNGLGSDSAGRSSGNGAGLAVGYGCVDTPMNSINLSIYDNEINVSSSILTGNGSTGSDAEVASGNGYGLLVGYNYVGSNFPVTVNATIQNNNIVINSGTLIGNGNAESGNSSGNGYGILIGENFIIDNNEVDTGDDYSINANYMKVSDSEVSGNGSFSGNDHYGNGNGYGISIGSNAETWIRYVDNSIDENVITIINSRLTGIGKSMGNSYFSGNGYGMFIGGGVYLAMYSDISISENMITISGSYLNGIGNSSFGSFSGTGNGYGILIGYNYSYNYEPVGMDIYGNEIYINSSDIEASSQGNFGNAWGIALGLNETYDASLAQNILTIEDSAITVNASGRDAYGIWMLVDSTFLTIDSVDNITRIDAGTGGGKIVLSDGTIVNSW